MNSNLFSRGRNTRAMGSSVQILSVPAAPVVPVAPTDWMAYGCGFLRSAVQDFSETDVWVICSRDCDTIEFARPIKLVLGATFSSLDSVYTTSLTDGPREFLVRPEEWKRHTELGEYPKRGLFVFVVCTNEWVELMPDGGLPVYEIADQYSTIWKLRGKVVKPCFVWSIGYVVGPSIVGQSTVG